MRLKVLLIINHDVVALGSRMGNVAGITIETEFLPYKDIDTISIYLNAKMQKPFYNYICISETQTSYL